MGLIQLEQELSANAYPGRGIVIGTSDDGKHAVAAYFIMGRSNNSRNRVFVEDGDGIRTQAFDPAQVEDPSLIIYAPVRVRGTDTIVTNGDQTDTIYDKMAEGMTFEESLRGRAYEPDAPNYTPRISGIIRVKDGGMSYALSILKRESAELEQVNRFTYSYEGGTAGVGRFIHTYQCDGDPLPSFAGDPKRVAVKGGIDAFTEMLWENLNEDNKVSLFVRYIDLSDGRWQTRIMNKHG